MVKYVLVVGLSDEEIRKETLRCSNLDKATIAEIIAFIGGKEMVSDKMLGQSGRNVAISALNKSWKSEFSLRSNDFASK